ncbi:MAG: exodeoxyribonuclease VII small subunit [Candidatus Nomurabacteria bacterium]|jgi:exodeoxyribonuclease VII small subunit|nr:exodeoxyribonuclease VII small subunit [Candidatus Nomurabacteria bacterium]
MSEKTIKQQLAEFEEVVAWFDSEDLDVEKATAQYEKGAKLAGEIKKRLETAKNRIKKLPSLVVAVICLVSFSAMPVGAIINDDMEVVSNKAGILMSPMSNFASTQRVAEVPTLKPGGKYDGEIKIGQPSGQTVEVFVEVAPYSVQSDADYAEDFSTYSERNKITSWTKLDIKDCKVDKRDNGRIFLKMRSKEECTIKYQVEVPKYATGGSQRALIAVQQVPDEQADDNVGVNKLYRIGYKLNVNIDGPNAKQSGQVIENLVPVLNFARPVFASSKVQNDGNVDFDIDYIFKAESIFGGTLFENTTHKSVLADSTRPNEAVWENPPFLGIYNITQEVNILGQTNVQNSLVLVMPFWLFLTVIAALVLLVAWLVFRKVKQNRSRKAAV